LKKLVVISLSLIMLYNLVGYFAMFEYVKHEWKAFVHQKLYDLGDEKSTVTFVFSKNEFDSNEQEFSINGHYYDVVKIENIHVDSVRVVCFDDEYESDLVAQYHDFIFQNMPQNDDFKHKTFMIFNKIIKEFLFEKNHDISTPSVFCVKKSTFNTINEPFECPFIDELSPPPKSILA
jgi:hypothetical protein